MSSADKFRWKFLIFLKELGSICKKLLANGFTIFVQISLEYGESLFFLGANNMLYKASVEHPNTGVDFFQRNFLSSFRIFFLG